MAKYKSSCGCKFGRKRIVYCAKAKEFLARNWNGRLNYHLGKAATEEAIGIAGYRKMLRDNRNLSKFYKGKLLTLAELKALPDGAVVYAYYREDGGTGPRIDGATRIKREADEGGLPHWSLDDGSGFGDSFTAQGEYNYKDGGWFPPNDDAIGCEEDTGEGMLRLFRAERKSDTKG